MEFLIGVIIATMAGIIFGSICCWIGVAWADFEAKKEKQKEKENDTRS